MKIGKIFTSISKALDTKIGKIGIKAAGIGALALVGYDAHCLGKIQADSYSKLKDGDAMKKYYVNTMTNDSPSTIQTGLKKELFDLEAENKARTLFNRVRGYVRGFGTMLINAAVPFALAVGTVATKGKASKVFATGLAGFGVFAFCRDILGWGNRDHLNKYI